MDLPQSVHVLCQAVKQLFRRWIEPNNDALVLNTAPDLTRSEMELVMENDLLRQQLIVVKRMPSPPPACAETRLASRFAPRAQIEYNLAQRTFHVRQ